MDEKHKYYRSYNIEPVSKKFLDKQELENLFKKQKKDSGINRGHYPIIKPGYVQQADLLFLPNDNGFKYLLVVVDLGSRLTDAEPLKNKTAQSVKDAFKEIYKRGILKFPKSRIETDPGSEFKGVVKDYFNKHGIRMRYGKPGRHKQQAVVESRNKIIGTALMKKMTAEELLTNQISRRWTDILPDILLAMNKHYSEQLKKLKKLKVNDEVICKGDTCNLLEIGTKVRAILDEPRNVLGEKQIGKFRAGDIRYDPKIRIIKNIILNPGQPPRYMLDDKTQPDGIEKVLYSKNELQVIPNDEMEPPGEIVLKERINEPDITYVVKKILDKKKIKGKNYLLISWKGFNSSYDTWEPYNEIKKSVPELVEEYENKHKMI